MPIRRAGRAGGKDAGSRRPGTAKRRALIPSAALIFAGLAIAVAAGAFTGLDQWSVDHLMPGASFNAQEAGLAEALIPLWGTHWDNAWSVAANVVTLPASFLIAVVLCAWRSRPLAVVVVAFTAVEALCKEVLSRPALFDGAHHIVGFDTSFPSGHTLRTVILAALVARPYGAAWAVASIVLLQLAGWHTPTDIAGGVLLGLLAVLVARALPGGSARGGECRLRGLLGARALRGRRLLRGAPRG